MTLTSSSGIPPKTWQPPNVTFETTYGLVNYDLME